MSLMATGLSLAGTRHLHFDQEDQERIAILNCREFEQNSEAVVVVESSFCLKVLCDAGSLADPIGVY